MNTQVIWIYWVWLSCLGGHLKGAMNLCNPNQLLPLFFGSFRNMLKNRDVMSQLSKLSNINSIDFSDIEVNRKEVDTLCFGQEKLNPQEDSPIIILYCEFSEKRAPKMFVSNLNSEYFQGFAFFDKQTGS